MPSNTRIQVRRGNASSWVSVNPILSQGEFGYEVDTGKLKVGDGQNAWNSLGYFPVEWSAVSSKPAVIAAGATQAAARSVISAASLDGNGKVPVSELPNSIMEYQGTWNASTNTPSLVNGTGNAGDVYRVSVAGSRDFGAGLISFDVGDYAIYNGSNWEKSDTTDAVSTVAGRTGDVTLAVADVSGAVASGGALGTPSSGNVSACVGQVADVCLVAFGKDTARATGTGDNPFGVKMQRAVTFSSVTYRAATADASGNLVVELRKNGVAVSGSAATIAAASQVAGGTATGTFAFAEGDILTVQVTGVGTTPGKGLVADIKGLTT